MAVSKFNIGLGGWKGTKMYPTDRYLMAEMSEGAIGIRLNKYRALISSACEGLEPYNNNNNFGTNTRDRASPMTFF